MDSQRLIGRLVGTVWLIGCLGLGVLAADSNRPRWRQTTLPNIVLIVADDLGWGATGPYGQKEIRTPHLDRLAAEGLRFTEAYSGSTVCAPSRCSLMTGRHTGHARIRSNDEIPLQPQDVTLAEVLRSVGYRTAAVGKWGLGWQGTTGHPRQQGFEEFYGYLGHVDAHNYYPPTLWRNEDALPLRGNQNFGRTTYAPDEFILAATNTVRLFQNHPFFLYYAPTLPHANNERGTNGMEIPRAGEYARKPWPLAERNKAAMITRLDEDVGRLLDTLKFYKLDLDTLVIFTSDNGPHVEGGCSTNYFRDTGGLRGLKRDLYEGGIRVPLIARWPGVIPAGKVSDRPVAFWDVLPTLAEIGRAPVPSGLDGLSFAPTLRGRGQTNQHEYFYWEFHEGGYRQALRFGDWKGIRLTAGQALELYDLGHDPGETKNVAAEHPETVARIEEILKTAADPWVKPTSTIPVPPWKLQLQSLPRVPPPETNPPPR